MFSSCVYIYTLTAALYSNRTGGGARAIDWARGAYSRWRLCARVRHQHKFNNRVHPICVYMVGMFIIIIGLRCLVSIYRIWWTKKSNNSDGKRRALITMHAAWPLVRGNFLISAATSLRARLRLIINSMPYIRRIVFFFIIIYSIIISSHE